MNDTAATMKAIAITSDKRLETVTRPRPVPGSGEVLIRVCAAGVNRADILQKNGLYPAPKGASDLPGLEVTGTIAALGEGVTEHSEGDTVCALLAGGGYAEYAVADAGSLLPKPADLSFCAAAALPEALFTVHANVFDACHLAPGERLLVHGGSSGIGTIAIQMARAHGCEVTATAGSERKCALATSLGAARAINYREEDFEAVIAEAGGVDVILDMVGGAYVQKNINILREGGRLVNIAYQNGPNVELNLLRVMLKRLILTGSTLRARPAAEKRRLRDGLKPLFWPAVEAGDIRPVIDSIHDMDDANTAHDRMESGAHAGKIVICFEQ